MHNPHRFLRRLTARAGVAALIVSGAAVLGAGTATAASCGGFVPCGEVHNNTSFSATVTTTLGQGPTRCVVWNANGGPVPKEQTMSCTRELLPPRTSKGGGTVDVDAFTFGTTYLLNVHGVQSVQNANIWTKIQNNEGAYCSNSLPWGVPSCEVVYQ